MEGESAHASSANMEIGAEPRYPTPCMLLKAIKVTLPNAERPHERREIGILLYTHTHAREKSLNFFALGNQQLAH